MPLRACYERSFCLSADVTAAYDPNFAEVYEKRNSALVNCGMGLCKYTGARGKSGASDAPAAAALWPCSWRSGTSTPWMPGSGAVHALPLETVGKLDCYMTFKGVKAIYEAK